jgi:phage shock protein A
MGYLKRWTSTVTSTVDGWVARLENHDALVDAALADLQRTNARARVQLTRVRRDGEALRRRRDEAFAQAEQWRQRARTRSQESEALECLRRHHLQRAEAARLTERLDEHARHLEGLERDVAELERRASLLRERRNVMRSRQARADALQLVEDSELRCGGSIEGIFDRWEERVVAFEIDGSVLDTRDAFERGLDDQESESRLRAELAALHAERCEDGEGGAA